MTIAVGSLVYVKTFNDQSDSICVVVSEGRPEFIGDLEGNYYYEVYCFATKLTFLCFSYELIIIQPENKSDDIFI